MEGPALGRRPDRQQAPYSGCFGSPVDLISAGPQKYQRLIRIARKIKHILSRNPSVSKPNPDKYFQICDSLKYENCLIKFLKYL